uniref:Ig-like domain-containing protein n=1 Tax=Moschus moschiferus TaxID=68415 RepID=A0A8C6CWJ2_MOSMO
MKRLVDTVLGLLFAQVCCVRGKDVTQSPPALSLQEGASSTLRCNFSTIADSVQWYLQNPGGRLIHLFYIPSGTKQDGRLKATTVPTERRSSLHISSSQTTDSGTYFCAVEHSAPQAPAASTQTPCGAQPLLQPQSHSEATTGHLQCLMLLTYISTVLTTDTF